MRYLVRGRVKPGSERSLLHAIERGTLGGSWLGRKSDGLRFVIARRHSKRKDRIGKSSSSWSKCRTRMTGASATISMAPSRGRAAIAIAHSGLRTSFKPLEARSEERRVGIEVRRQ